ncbi:MAG TPA: tetratricopeptide repeat protein [Flavobacteriales bacterium]|nr:tetratricopeptide repeat protein [Flavobacteriales bacterium]
MKAKLNSVCCLLAVLCSTSLFAQTVSHTNYIISHVNVIPMNVNTVLKDQDVYIEGQLIREIAPSGKIKSKNKAVVVDGRGKYLIPGLMDMHVHFYYEQDVDGTAKSEVEVMLANGITHARVMCGDREYLKTKENIATGKWNGPALKVVSPQFAGEWPWPGRKLAMVVTSEEEARKAVRESKNMGYDEVKITFFVKQPVYNAIIDEARKQGLNVTGHIGPDVKLPAALVAKQQVEHLDEFLEILLPDTNVNHGVSVSGTSIWQAKAWETLDKLDEKRIPLLVDMVKKAGIAITPTNYFLHSSFGTGQTDEEIKNLPDYAYIPAVLKEDRYETREHYWKKAPSKERRDKFVQLRNKITYELWKSGVLLMAGSDSPEWFLVQGFSLHNELESFVKAGLTPFAALQTTTVNTAKYMNLYSNYGSIETGKRANLILLSANPLEDIKNTRKIEAVFKEGKLFTRSELDQWLSNARAAYQYKSPHDSIGIIYLERAEYYRLNAKPDSALLFCSKAENEFKETGNYKGLMGAWNKAGAILARQDKYDAALESLGKAIDFSREINDTSNLEIAATWLNMGVVYNALENTDRSLYYHNKALNVRMRLEGELHSDVATSYGNLGTVYRGIKNYEKALEAQFKAMNIRSKLYGNDSPEVAESYYNLGHTYKEKKEYDNAIKYYDMALVNKIKQRGTGHKELVKYYKNISEVYTLKGEKDKAGEYIKIAEEINTGKN